MFRSGRDCRRALFDLFQRRMRRLGKERLRGHDHAVCAITALSGLLGNESGLKSIRFFRCSETFESCNGAARDLFDGRDAGAHGLSVEHHCAGATLAEPATEFCAVQRERIAQDVEKRLVRIPGIDCYRATVDAEFVLRHAIIICQIRGGCYRA